MNDRVNFYLDSFVDNPMVNIGHAAGLLWVGFIKTVMWTNYGWIPEEKAALALHVQAPWRVCRDNRVLFGQEDLFSACDLDANERGVETQGSEFDQRMQKWLNDMRNDRVVSCTVNECYDLRIVFSNGDVFETWGNSYEDVEYWRVLFFDREVPDLVAGGKGYELI